MFIVVSRWKVSTQDMDEFMERGRHVRNALLEEPGVVMIESFQSDSGDLIAIVGYDDRNVYDQIVNTPNGPFNTALREHRLEEVAQWVGSDRGDANVDD